MEVFKGVCDCAERVGKGLIILCDFNLKEIQLEFDTWNMGGES